MSNGFLNSDYKHSRIASNRIKILSSEMTFHLISSKIPVFGSTLSMVLDPSLNGEMSVS
jgi:hypothetical protein